MPINFYFIGLMAGKVVSDMSPDFAERLMQRPLCSRWVTTPSPKKRRKIAALLVKCDGINAEVYAPAYQNNWIVPLDKIQYR